MELTILLIWNFVAKKPKALTNIFTYIFDKWHSCTDMCETVSYQGDVI